MAESKVELAGRLQKVLEDLALTDGAVKMNLSDSALIIEKLERRVEGLSR